MDIAAGYISRALQHTVLPAGTDPNGLPALFLTYYILLGFGGLFFYLSIASFSYFFFFRLEKDKFYPGTGHLGLYRLRYASTDPPLQTHLANTSASKLRPNFGSRSDPFPSCPF